MPDALTLPPHAKLLLPASMIHAHIGNLAAGIIEERAAKERSLDIHLVGVNVVGTLMMADFARAIQEQEVATSSYDMVTVVSHRARDNLYAFSVDCPSSLDVEGKDVVTPHPHTRSGRLAQYLERYLLHKGANSVTHVSLIDQPTADRDWSPHRAVVLDHEQSIFGYGIPSDPSRPGGYWATRGNIYTMPNSLALSLPSTPRLN